MTKLEDINEGDLVKVTDGKKSITDYVVSSGKTLYINPSGTLDKDEWILLHYYSFAHMWRSIEVIERAKPPLPTEPGVYAANGCAYVLDEDGVWWYGYEDRSVSVMAASLTFSEPPVRLAPVAEVLGRVLRRNSGNYDYPIREVAAEYKVELP